MFSTLNATFASTSYFWSTISSTGSTANTDVIHKTDRTHVKVRRLLIPQRHHRIDFHGAARGNITGQRGGDAKKTDHGGVGHDVCATDPIQHRRDKTRETDRRDDAERDAEDDQR